ncbi:hypothetical protein P4E94_19285 [Pontiellaceae bacterium B12219]|nr:hypothetical protein [Pontiellaceae bacterium B12219]
MKKILTSIFTIAILTIILGLSFGCASTKAKRLSSDEFVELVNQLPTYQMNSFTWGEYLGTSSSRAYIEISHPAFIGKGSIVKIYWIEKSDLPNEFREKIENGIIYPWDEKGYSEIIDESLNDVPGLRIQLDEEFANQNIEPMLKTPVE